MSIGFSLGIIRALDLVAVPVEVQDSSAVFHFEGALTAIFTDIREDTLIQWAQTGGIPVTFTSPLDGESITFTSNDLDKKEFTCCTNPGTDAELCNKAEFYHYPVSWADGRKLDELEDAYGVTNPDYPLPADFKVYDHYGMMPIDSTLPGYSDDPRVIGNIQQFTGLAVNYREMKIVYSMTAEAIKAVRKVEIIELDPGGENLLSTLVGSPTLVLGLPDSTHPLKLRFYFHRFGYEYINDVYIAGDPSPGTSEIITLGTGQPSYVGEMSTILSSIKNLNFTDSIGIDQSSAAYSATSATVIQSRKDLDFIDSISVQSGKPANGITGLVTNLQTALSVT